MSSWDEEVDVVVVGSGAAAMSAAISAADGGLSVLMVESTDKWGGSTAMSGGGMWLPDNRLMQRDGAGDSREEALTYMEATIGQAGDPGAPSSRARKEAFVDNVNGFVDMVHAHGLRFARAKEYPDYYPELPGGKIGRAIESVIVDAKTVGDWWATSRGQDGVAMPVMTDDVWLLARAWSTPGGFARGAQLVGRALATVVKGQRAVGCGAALAVSMLGAIMRQNTRLWLEAPVTDLVLDGGRVRGVEVEVQGHTKRLGARRGVVLGAGGFAANRQWREKYHGVPGWTSANPGNTGALIEIAARHGAQLEMMDDAWWGGSVPAPTSAFNPSFLVAERSMPFSIIVDQEGKRFANESESYIDLGHHMLANLQHTPGKMWLILDARHTRRYLRSFAITPGLGKALKANGMLHEAKTLPDLARATGLDLATFRETVERFNAMARTGVDQDFGRGNSAYDRYYGDPTHKPNPNLGTIEKGPFLAYELVPGDLGTKGGVLTDEKARVLRNDGDPIDGLYAAGNVTASVMGHTYPGPGATLGPAVVFGYIAGRELAS